MPQQERINSYVDLSAIEKETKIFVDNLNLIVAKMAEISKSAEANGIALGKAVPKEVQTNLQQTNKLMTEAVEVEKKMTVASIQYEKAIEEAKQAKQAYNYELKKTVEAETAAEGSLKQMRAQLSMVNKQYDALSKAERENAAIGGRLQKQSASLTAELKKLEAATGRNQRNVGNYAEAINVATMSLGQMRQTLRSMKNADVSAFNPEQLAAYNRNMALLTDEMGDYNARLRAAGDGTANMIDAMNGLVGVVQVGLGVMSAFGIENKNLEKTMITLMSVSQGLSSIHKMMEAQTLKNAAATIKETFAKANLTIATWAQNKADKASSSVTKSLFRMLAKNPYLAIAAAVTTATAAVVAMVIALQKEKDTRVQLEDAHKEAIKSTTAEFSNVRQLQAILKSNTASYQEKTAAIQKLKEIMPGYNAQLSDSGKLMWQNTNAIRTYTAQLYNKIKLELAESKAKPLIDAQIEAAEKLKILLPDLAKGGASVSDAFGKQTRIMIDEATGTILEYRDAIDYFDVQTGKMVKGASGWAPLVSVLDGELGNLTATYIEFGKQVTALLDIPVVANIEPITQSYEGTTKQVAAATKEIEKMGIIFGNVIPEMQQQIESAPENYKDAATSIEELKGSFAGLNYLLNNEIITPDEWGEYWTKLVNIALEKSEKIKETFFSFTGEAMKTLSAYDEYKTAREDAELQRYEQQQTAQQEALEQRLASGQISQAQYDAAIAGLEEQADQRNAEIAQRRAKRERALASFNVAITTAQAIMKFLVDPGGIIGMVFSALAATTGAFQLAAINSAPLPAYAEGRDGGKAERAIVGEAGREIVRTDKGFFLTPNAPTLVDLPAGADVIPNDQIAKFMSGQIINDDLPDQMLGGKIDNLAQIMKNKEFVKFEVTRAGMALVAQNGLNKTRYINQNLRR